MEEEKNSDVCRIQKAKRIILQHKNEEDFMVILCDKLKFLNKFFIYRDQI